MVITPIGNNAWLALIAAVCYVIGSFPTAYLITKGMTGKDIRFEGSRNVGSMNAFRVIRDEKTGTLAVAGFAMILATDIGKGMLAIALARWLSLLGYNPAIALILASLFVVLGHSYPFYFKFKAGGRGIASFMGVLLALNEPSLPIWGGIVLASIFATHYALTKRVEKKLSVAFRVLGTQVVGRVVGMGVGLVPLYFFDPKLFFPALAAIILILVRHIDRAKACLKKPAAS